MEHLILLVEIMLINMVLSGDNAVVIAMASKHLPERERRQAVWWGACGAVLLRLVLTAIAVILLEVPWLQAVGGIMLLSIAIQLLNEGESHGHIRQAASIGAAIWTIIVADFIMSLDNVLAIAGVAEGNFWILVLGIAMSIPIIIWGSNLIMKLLDQFTFLMFLGAGILAYTAGEMFVKDKAIQQWLNGSWDWLHVWVPVIFTVIVIGFGWIKKRARY